MPMFDAMNAAGSGLYTYQVWLDALSNNIANVNTVRPTSESAFQAEYVQAQSIGTGDHGTGGGVEVAGITRGSAEGRLTFDPENPAADATGYVRLPDIDMGEQMGNLIMAQRAFQANAAVVDRAYETYQSAIDIGKKA
jgi:flagellar basal-body rod protein FlgC